MHYLPILLLVLVLYLYTESRASKKKTIRILIFRILVNFQGPWSPLEIGLFNIDQQHSNFKRSKMYSTPILIDNSSV